jgi:hypothetical protein
MVLDCLFSRQFLRSLMESSLKKISKVLSTASYTEAMDNFSVTYLAQVSLSPVILLNTNLPSAWSTRSVTK